MPSEIRKHFTLFTGSLDSEVSNLTGDSEADSPVSEK
jgi:hypothetical protein